MLNFLGRNHLNCLYAKKTSDLNLSNNLDFHNKLDVAVWIHLQLARQRARRLRITHNLGDKYSKHLCWTC